MAPLTTLQQSNAPLVSPDTVVLFLRVWLSLIVITASRCVLLVATRVAIVTLQRNVLWARIFDYLTREKILQILLRPPVRATAPPEATYRRYLQRLASLPTLIGRINPFHAAAPQAPPAPDQFLHAWASILRKQVLGVLPAKAGGGDAGGKSLQQAMTAAEDIFRNVVGARRFFIARQRAASALRDEDPDNNNA